MTILDTLSAFDPLEWMALVAGLLYIILAARGLWLCWIFGIISCAIIAFKDFTTLRLYFDGVLQLIYVLMGVWGLIGWRQHRASSGKGSIKVISMNLRSQLPWWIVLSLIAFVMAWAVKSLTDVALPYLDSWTTVFSLFATWLTIRRVVENWLYWILIDLIYIFIFYRQGAVLFSVLYGVYTAIAVYGYYKWRTNYLDQSSQVV